MLMLYFMYMSISESSPHPSLPETGGSNPSLEHPTSLPIGHAIPIGWINLADIAATHPGLETEILSLAEEELDLLADNLYDALYELYRSTFEEILMDYLAWRQSLDEPERMASSEAKTSTKTDPPIQQSLPLG
ncbi:MAG: hypothetical protein ACYDBJ_13455 [Aggregatilineales bacterium]